MALDWNNIFSGGVGGASAGAALGPWGMAAGGLLGAFSANKRSPGVDSLLPKIDANAETNTYMRNSSGESDMQASLNDSVAGQQQNEVKALIAGGVDPASAARIASSHANSSSGQGREGINSSLASLRGQVFNQYRQMQNQREDDRASYRYMQSGEKSPLQQMLPLISAAWLQGGGLEKFKERWGKDAPRTGTDTVLDAFKGKNLGDGIGVRNPNGTASFNADGPMGSYTGLNILGTSEGTTKTMDDFTGLWGNGRRNFASINSVQPPQAPQGNTGWNDWENFDPFSYGGMWANTGNTGKYVSYGWTGNGIGRIE